MAKYNKQKLYKILSRRKSIWAASRDCFVSLENIKGEISDCRRNIGLKDQGFSYKENREIYDARKEGRNPKETNRFLDIPVDEMLERYQKHDIANVLNINVVERYVFLHEELKSIEARNSELTEEANALNGLANNIETFLKKHGEHLPEGVL